MNLRHNAEILRQFSTYVDEYSDPNNSFSNKARCCLLCVGNRECEICSLKSKFGSEIQHIVETNHPYRLRDIEAYLLSAKNIERSMADTPAHGREEVISNRSLPVLLKMKHIGSFLRRKSK
jgi:hypothetical protein